MEKQTAADRGERHGSRKGRGRQDGRIKKNPCKQKEKAAAPCFVYIPFILTQNKKKAW